MALTGWEVKALRMGKAQLTDSYVLMKDGEAWLLGAQVTPLDTASTHFVTDPTRTRKLLLHKKELAKITRRRLPKRADLRMHPAVLERPPGEGPDRPGQGQAVTRQARHRKRPRLEPAEAAGDSRQRQAVTAAYSARSVITAPITSNIRSATRR